MPMGSPGMEMGNQRHPFVTLLVMGDGSTEAFQRHTYLLAKDAMQDVHCSSVT
jgi:hypothetical protein